METSIAAPNQALVPVERALSETAAGDCRIVAMWLHGRAPNTVRAYQAEADRFMAAVCRPLQEVTLSHLQRFVDGLTAGPASRARTLAAVKSLLSFAHRTGYLPHNVGAGVRLPPYKQTLAERILDEPDVHRLIAIEPDVRNRLILLLLYAGGLRISELTGLKRRDAKARKDGGQLTVFGKGGKTRAVLLSKGTWKQLATVITGEPDAPLFRSRQGGHLDPSQVHRIVKAAALRAGLDPKISAHWLRHAHASHALDRGAPLQLVRDTLGHASISTTNRYAHARPGDSSARYLAV